jgi:cytochrome bd ubiquinol oxidase subunit II
MELFDILKNIWFVLIGVLFIGYSILDGFDFGVGMLMPFIAKEDKDKKVLIDTIWPVWDGNEVWLVTGAGALFAAFPAAYASVFSGFYLLIMLTLFSLIFRAVSMEFWYHDIKRKKLWAAAFSIGSVLPPLFLGLLIGNIILGMPLNDKFLFTADISVIFRPFPVLTAILVTVFMIIHGSTYTALKTEGSLRNKASVTAGRLWFFALFLFIITVISVFLFFPERSGNPLMWIFSLIIFAALLILKKAINIQKAGLSFLLSSFIFAGLWICAGALLYPNLINGIQSQNSISIYNASSSEPTLRIMLIFALIGMPIVICYSIYVYRVFKGKVANN